MAPWRFARSWVVHHFERQALSTLSLPWAVLFIILLAVPLDSLAEVSGDNPRRDVTNGTYQAPGDRPYMARIQFYDGGFCSGTVIHPEYVLTAAHCAPNEIVPDGEITVEFNAEVATRAVRSMVMHPGWTWNPAGNFSVRYDAMLVRLWQPVDIEPVTLATMDHYRFHIYPHEQLTVSLAGYGYSWCRGDNCYWLYSGMAVIKDLESFELGFRFDSNSPSRTENGDSGGPVFDSSGIQIGIISTRDFCASVAHLYTWIRNTIQAGHEYPRPVPAE